MRARTAILLTCWLATTGLSGPAANQFSDTPVTGALRFFQGVTPDDLTGWLQARRPARISADEHVRAVAVLPEKGELIPERHERVKLAMIDRVLVYHDRAEGFEIRLIDVPQAVVALYQRAVILVSRPALRLVSGAQLQALVAHEIGHEYFWPDFERTLERGDNRGRQELELKCDGVAVLTLIGMGGSPAQLATGLRKMLRFNASIGAAANADEYPGMQEREQLVKAVWDLAVRSRGVGVGRQSGRIQVLGLNR